MIVILYIISACVLQEVVEIVVGVDKIVGLGVFGVMEMKCRYCGEEDEDSDIDICNNCLEWLE